MSDTILKITQIASGDLWAGAEVQLFTLCNALKELKHIELNVILLNHGELEHKLISSDIKVHIFDESKLSSIRIYKLLCQHLVEFRPGVIHSHRMKENILSSIAAKQTGIPFSIRTLHGAPEFNISWTKPHKKLLNWLNIFTGRYLQQKIVAVSPALANDISNLFAKSHIALIENGVDINSLEPYAIKSHNKLLNNPLKFGIAGRLVNVKRVDVFLAIAKEWVEQHTDKPAEFYIYGDGPLNDELKQLTIRYNLVDVVHFMGHSNQIHQAISSLDALLITSDHEGLPMTLLEAMALGTPVIAHAVGGIPRVLDEQCGWLINSQDARVFVDNLINCVMDTDNKIRRLEMAKSKINKFYSAKTNAQAYYDLYRNLESNKSI